MPIHQHSPDPDCNQVLGPRHLVMFRITPFTDPTILLDGHHNLQLLPHQPKEQGESEKTLLPCGHCCVLMSQSGARKPCTRTSPTTRTRRSFACSCHDEGRVETISASSHDRQFSSSAGDDTPIQD
jgi:hypothetical protein